MGVLKGLGRKRKRANKLGISCLDNHPPHYMEALKAEIASKRKARDNGPPRPNKYMRRGDIERMKEEEEQKAREEAARKAEVEAEQAAQPKVRFRHFHSNIHRDIETSLELRITEPAAPPLWSPHYLVLHARPPLQPPTWARVHLPRLPA